RQGVTIGMSPLVIALHRFVWPGLVFLPILAANGFADLRAVGVHRAVALAVFGGLPLALFSYLGYVLVPLGHGALIQPACAALGGLMLAWLVLEEPPPLRRIVGAAAMLAGLLVIGAEALRTIGRSGLVGDLLFVAAGSFFAVFGMLLRMWLVPPPRAGAGARVPAAVGVADL